MSNSSTTILARQKPDGPIPVRIESHRATVPVLIARAGENAARRFWNSSPPRSATRTPVRPIIAP